MHKVKPADYMAVAIRVDLVLAAADSAIRLSVLQKI